MPGRGGHQGLDAVHGRRRTGMRGLRRQAFPRRDTRSEIPRQVDLRRAGNDRRRRHRVFRRGQKRPDLQTHRRTAQTIAGRGAGLHQARAVVVDPFGRREPAREAGVVPDQGQRPGRRDVHLRRADDGAAFPRHQQAAGGIQRPDRTGAHDRHRGAQHGRIKCADWVVDLGPEAGTGGGRVVFEGTPRNLEQCPASYTGKYLRLRTKL